MSAETPSLADVLDLYLAQDRAQFHVAVPARVKSYDPATKTAVVEPMTKVVSRDGDGDRIVDTLPVMPAVPVAWPRGGGYFLYLPLLPGDGGLLVFTDTDLGAWRDSGEVSDPGDERRHAVGGAVFYPGLDTVARVLADGTDHLVLGKEGGPGVHIDGSFVQLGAAGGVPVALATPLVDWITTILLPALAANTPTIVVAPPTGPTLFAATLVKAT